MATRVCGRCGATMRARSAKQTGDHWTRYLQCRTESCGGTGKEILPLENVIRRKATSTNPVVDRQV